MTASRRALEVAVTQAAATLAADAVEVMQEEARPVTLTWLNHYSIQHVDWGVLEQFDFVGLDGTFLSMILEGSLRRTSADLIFPLFESSIPGLRTALIGAAPGVAELAGSASRNCVYTRSGYGEFDEELIEQLRARRPNLIVLGLGTPLQDRVAEYISRELELPCIVMTAGGLLDQLSRRKQYFPPLVHYLRLGWAWRLMHEPRRLAGRYTTDAVGALLRRTALQEKCRRHLEIDVSLDRRVAMFGLNRLEGLVHNDVSTGGHATRAGWSADAGSLDRDARRAHHHSLPL
jgi:UDP-N-acetyl-D-mannosaminuronic acid transferase (WecB/TagA/CpsF family)